MQVTMREILKAKGYSPQPGQRFSRTDTAGKVVSIGPDEPFERSDLGTPGYRTRTAEPTVVKAAPVARHDTKPANDDLSDIANELDALASGPTQLARLTKRDHDLDINEDAALLDFTFKQLAKLPEPKRQASNDEDLSGILAEINRAVG